MKNVHHVSTMQHGGMKSGIWQSKTKPFCKLDASALSCSNM